MIEPTWTDPRMYPGDLVRLVLPDGSSSLHLVMSERQWDLSTGSVTYDLLADPDNDPDL